MTSPEQLKSLTRRIYLMRHAEVAYFDAEGRPKDPRTVPLTAEGRKQALTVAASLDPVSIDRVICSGMSRTVETAEIVTGRRGIALETEEAFREIRGGRLRDIPPEQLTRAFAEAYAAGNVAEASFLGGERFGDCRDRVADGLGRIVADTSWRNALVVAHDVVNRIILGHFAGIDLAAVPAFEQDPACINIIELMGHDPASVRRCIRAINLTPYDLVKERLFGHSMEIMSDQLRPERIYRDSSR